MAVGGEPQGRSRVLFGVFRKHVQGRRTMKPCSSHSGSGFFLVVGLLLIAANTLEFFHGTHVAGSDATAATYSHGILHVSIPYHGLRFGGGRLILEVRDPENGIVGRAERRVETEVTMRNRGRKTSSWRRRSKWKTWFWHRLRYHFCLQRRGGGAGGHRVDFVMIIRMPVVHVLGQQFLSGGRTPAALRIIGYADSVCA